MENLEVMVILFIIVILGYVACKLGYMGDKFDKKLYYFYDTMFYTNLLYSVLHREPFLGGRAPFCFYEVCLQN